MADTTVTTVNVANVRDYVRNSRNEIDRQKQSISEITKTIEFMEDAWDSDAQRVYEQKYQATRKEVEEFNTTMESYMRMLMEFVEDCAATDRAVQGDLSSVSW
jgi:uncharacterized protein YukE